MTLNGLLNKLLHDQRYLDWASDILEDLNRGKLHPDKRFVSVKINDDDDKQEFPAVLVVDGLEIKLPADLVSNLLMGLDVALKDQWYTDHPEETK